MPGLAMRFAPSAVFAATPGLKPSRDTDHPMNHDTQFLLHLADNALVLGQRNAEWCGHGPILEEDIAMANISLDLIGQARLLYQLAATRMGSGATEDSLAYFRNPEEFRNFTLLELPHSTAVLPSAAVERDYAVTICRNYLYSCFMQPVWVALEGAADEGLAAIAAKSTKEVRYHLSHASGWMVRLGDGTETSRARMQAALDHLMPYTQELWLPFPSDEAAKSEENTPETIASHGQLASKINTILSEIQAPWKAAVQATAEQAGLRASPATGHVTRGKFGQHSEHLSYLLMELQSLARAHPGAVW
jgi:ring-1,2-phenylacetyl-CoA epoxidase subunit PaaC